MKQFISCGVDSDGEAEPFNTYKIKKESITVTTNGSGSATSTSTAIYGTILKIHYQKGTVNAGTTAVTTITATTEQVDSKDVNTAANQITYPCVGLNGASAGDNKWTRFVVGGTLTVTVSGGATSKSFTVNVYYEG